MIEVNELRVGNIVRTPKGALYNGVVKALEPTDLIRLLEGEVEFYPVEVTEESLYRLGVKSIDMGYMVNYDIRIYNPLRLNGSGGYSRGDLNHLMINDELVGGKPIDSIHRIQNIFYDITGNQLQYKTEEK